MALYDVVNKETGEKKVVECLSMTSNSGMKTTPSGSATGQGGASNLGAKSGVGEWKTNLANKHSGWKHILDKVKNTPKSNAKDLY